MTRRAIYGAGKQSAGSFTYYFQLDAAEDAFKKTKDWIKDQIKEHLIWKVNELLMQYPVNKDNNWAPKLPMCKRVKGEPSKNDAQYHDHVFEFTTYFSS